jgi:hypothetical protein
MYREMDMRFWLDGPLSYQVGVSIGAEQLCPLFVAYEILGRDRSGSFDPMISPRLCGAAAVGPWSRESPRP